ncbi:MAG TPA: hypothetical protein VF526_04860 [Solirubrobacteraceae bacterium]|jgi:hypothetical protein
MVFTMKLLVIANRTVDSNELFEVLRARAGRGPIEVTLVAPSTRGRGDETAQRLERAVQAIGDAGIPVEGVQGDPDPMIAVADTWDPRRFDEVVVATLPGATSRWLAANLPKRVERFTGAQVTHVVAHSSGSGIMSGGERGEQSLRR